MLRSRAAYLVLGPPPTQYTLAPNGDAPRTTRLSHSLAAALAASSPPLTRVAKVVATLFDAEGKSHGPHAFLMDLRRGGRLVDGGKVNIL